MAARMAGRDSDDDVVVLDDEPAPPRLQRTCKLDVGPALTTVSYTDLDGRVVVVDLTEDEDGPEPVASPHEPPAPVESPTKFQLLTKGDI
jgi:hypothetical protein